MDASATVTERHKTQPQAGAPPGEEILVRRQVNWPLVLITLGVVVVLAVGGYFWHGWQVDRIAGALNQRAERYLKDGEAGKAASCLWRYLRLHPDDADARCRLAEVYDKSATAPREKLRAIELYYQAIGVASATRQFALRIRLAELLLELRRPAEAETEAKKLLQTDPINATAQRLLTLAVYQQFEDGAFRDKPRQGKPPEELLRRALKANPGDIELSVALARLLRINDAEETALTEETRQLDLEVRAREADALVDQMVQDNPSDPEAYLARYRYRDEFGLPGREEDVEAALECGAESLEVLLVAGHFALNRYLAAANSKPPEPEADQYYEQSKRHFGRVVDVAPEDPRGYLGLGDAYATRGELEAAIDAWSKGLEATDLLDAEFALRIARALYFAKSGVLEKAKVERLLGTLDRVAGNQGAFANRSQRDTFDRWRLLAHGRQAINRRQPYEALDFAARATVAGKSGQGEGELTSRLEAQNFLATVYGRLGWWEQAASAYEQAALLAPEMASLRQAAGDAWSQAGRFNEAVRCYGQALQIQQTPGLWRALAWVLLRQELLRPKSQRRWRDFLNALARAKEATKDAPPEERWRLDYAESLYELFRETDPVAREQAKGKVTERFRLLEQQYAKVPDLLQRLVLRYEELGLQEDADRVLGKLAAMKDVPAELIAQLRSSVLLRRGRLDDARQTLLAGLQKASPAAAEAMEIALVNLDIRDGKPDQARRRLVRLHSRDPNNLGVVRRLAELALDRGQLRDAEHWIKMLRSREGKRGVYWRYYEARRLLADSAASNSAVDKAVELQAEIERYRPEWPFGYLLKGQVFERQGMFLGAVDAYKQAVELGASTPAIYERLISLLVQTRQFDAANRYLAQLRETTVLSERLESLQMFLALQSGDAAAAAALAKRAVDARPEDAMAWVRLGQTLTAAQRSEEAEAAFLQAVQISPEDARVRAALFNFYLKTKQVERARQLLDQLAAKGHLKDQERTALLSRGYELIGDQQKAEAAYQEAMRLMPDNPTTHLRWAEYLLRSTGRRRLDEAERALRRVLQLAPETDAARRLLASVLAMRGGAAAWQEAFRLLQAPGSDAATVDRRLQALFLVSRGGTASFEKARQLLEDLLSDPRQTTDGDLLLLAKLDETEGKFQSAEQRYVSLLGRADPQPDHLAAYIDFLLRRDAADRATGWLNKLESVAGDSANALALRARWLKARGEPVEAWLEEKAKSLLEGAGEDNNRQLAAMKLVGDTYTLAELHAAAEPWYRKVHERQPAAFAPLALSLARQGRLDEAIDLCLEGADLVPPARTAGTLAAVLTAGSPTPEHAEKLPPVFNKWLEKSPNDANLIFAVSLAQLALGHMDESIRLCQRLVEVEPENVAALNNLATLLGEQSGSGQPGMEYVDKAIRIAGPRAYLMDTKGMLLLYDGKLKEAIACLEDAVHSLAVDPRYHFHLAVAYLRVGRKDDAARQFAIAQRTGLANQILTPTDQRLLKELNVVLP